MLSVNVLREEVVINHPKGGLLQPPALSRLQDFTAALN